MRRSRRRAPLAALLTLLLAVGATACGRAVPDTGPVPADTARAQKRSSDPRSVEAEKSALAAYTGYLAASRKAELVGDPRYPELTKYLADPLLTRVRLAIRDAKEHGAMRTGKLISEPTVTAVNLDTVPATVAIQDCIDATGYHLVYVKDRKVVPGSASGRYLATATATRYADGRWLVSDGNAHQDQPC